MISMLETLKAMLEEEQELYVPHPDTCKFLIGQQIPPSWMRMQLVLSQEMADQFVQAGMHPSDILVMDKLPEALPKLDIGLDPWFSVAPSRGKGKRKDWRTRWGGSRS